MAVRHMDKSTENPLHVASSVVVLLTTRFDTVAVETGMDYTHRVDLMSLDIGWELLWKSMGIKEEKKYKIYMT